MGASNEAAIRLWGEEVARLLVAQNAAPDESEGWKLAGKLMAGAHMGALDSLVPLSADGQLGRAWAVDFLAARPAVLDDLEELSREHLREGPHFDAVMALLDAAKS